MELRIGISRCLLGDKVRYDGKDKLDENIRETLGKFAVWVPVCPEVEFGLTVPREEMRLIGAPLSPRLVTVNSGLDHTDGMLAWTARKIEELEKEDLCAFVFKARSPSCGIRDVKVTCADGHINEEGAGVFTNKFRQFFPRLPIEDEVRLLDDLVRDRFIEQLFMYWRYSRGNSSPNSIAPPRRFGNREDGRLPT